MQNNRFYKIKDVAEMSGLSKHFIRKSISEKQLNAIKTGKIFFIHLDDFNKFINNLRVIKEGKSQNKPQKDYFCTQKTDILINDTIANSYKKWL